MKNIYYQSNKQMKSKKNLIMHGFFLSLYGFVKYLPFPFCNYLRYLVIKLFSPKIISTGISEGVTLFFPWNIEIDKNSTLNQGVFLNGFAGIKIGEGVRIAPNVSIQSVNHNFENPDEFIYKQGFKCAKVVIEDDVWIGTNVCINMGVTIGQGSVIGAGSIVVKDIPPYSIAVGVPAKVIRKRENNF